MHNKNELKILDKAMDLVEQVYLLTKKLPKEEIYGLTSQIRRCSVSIPSNIAEGAGRNSDNEFIHFLSIANGSSYELETQLMLCERLTYFPKDDLMNLLKDIDVIQKMNYKLKLSLAKASQ